MIKLLGICGSPVKGSNLMLLMKEALKGVSREQVEWEIFSVQGKSIRDCQHCNWCMAKQTKEKFCAIEDDMSPLYPRILEADALLVGSPVYLGRLSGHLASVLDRVRCLHYGKAYQGSMKHKVGAAMAVSWYRNSGLETTLCSIHWAFLTYQMIIAVPGSISTFGGVGLTSLEGSGRFDPRDKRQVLKDQFGMQTAKATVQGLVELAALVKAGTQALGREKQ